MVKSLKSRRWETFKSWSGPSCTTSSGGSPGLILWGRVVSGMLFRLDPSGKFTRRPDLAFVSYGRWARDRIIGVEDGWDEFPPLAIEVVSPSNRAAGVITKVGEYFRAGVLRVWVIYPTDRLV